jgi:hypothetical protein
MSRLDDLTAELIDKLIQPGVNADAEIRQRLFEAWQEGQIGMRTRADEARKGLRPIDPLDLPVTEDFV